MHAIVNRFGIVVGLATKDLGKDGFDYVSVTDKKIIKAIQEKRSVRYVEGNLEIVTPFRSKTWDQIRAEREVKLAAADAALFRVIDTELLDNLDLTDQKKSIADYRQKLRDLPETFDNPDEVVFPAPPF